MLIGREVLFCKEFVADLSDGGGFMRIVKGIVVFAARDDKYCENGCYEDGWCFHFVKLDRNGFFWGVVFPTVDLVVLTGTFSFSPPEILYF